MKIILASQSPQRKLMMDSLGIDYEIVPSDLDESKIEEKDGRKRVLKLAQLKAEDVSSKNPEAIVIAADTFALFEDRAIEKPKSLEEAREMLKMMSGKWITALTATSIKNEELRMKNSNMFEILAKFRELSDRDIENYIQSEPVKTWSAAFCPGYPTGAALIEKVDGDLTSFLYGLPLPWVIEKLRESGVKI